MREREVIQLIVISLISIIVGYGIVELVRSAPAPVKPTRCACHFETGLIIEDNCE